MIRNKLHIVSARVVVKQGIPTFVVQLLPILLVAIISCVLCVVLLDSFPNKQNSLRFK